MNSGSIHFYFSDRFFSLKERKKLKSFIEKKIRSLGKKTGEVSIVFCSDKNLLALNRRFLKHDYYTDILTFDFCQDNIIKGEIFISLDRIRENAQNFKESVNKELHRVIFHGILHLLGFSDKSKSEKNKMTTAEDSLLKEYFS
jgi:rRNA maturation RNase YbeY